MIYSSHNYEVESIIPASEILLPGVHNVENYMAAFAAVDGLVSPEMCRKVARSYGGVTHRLELIRKLGRRVVYKRLHCNQPDPHDSWPARHAGKAHPHRRRP